MKHHIRAALVAISCIRPSTIVTAQGASPASVDTAALAWAKRLVAATHSQEAFARGLDSAFASARSDNSIPKVFFDSLSARTRSLIPQFMDSLAVLYVTSLSAADLKALAQFYESPLGQRYAAAQLAFQEEFGTMAKRWGMRVSLDVMKDLLDKGLIPDISH